MLIKILISIPIAIIISTTLCLLFPPKPKNRTTKTNTSPIHKSDIIRNENGDEIEQ